VVVVNDGGYVTIEEGGHVGKLFVYTGGIAELCCDAIVDQAYECGGAVYGSTEHVHFAAVSIHFGSLYGDRYMTLHEGSVMWDTNICGGELNLHNNSHMEGGEVFGEINIHGGYHSELVIEKGGTAFIDGGVIMDIEAKEGSRVVIFKDAAIFNGEFHGKVEYAGKDFYNNPNFVNCHCDKDIEYFDLGDVLSKKASDLLSEED
jgi:hypothetical protein